MEGQGLNQSGHLNVLWTSDNVVTAEKMVFMYTKNAIKYGWWDSITLIVWGAATALAATSQQVQALIAEAQEAGVKVSACKECADQLAATDQLESMGVEVKYWGPPLTEILKSGAHLLSV